MPLACTIKCSDFEQTNSRLRWQLSTAMGPFLHTSWRHQPSHLSSNQAFLYSVSASAPQFQYSQHKIAYNRPRLDGVSQTHVAWFSTGQSIRHHGVRLY